MSSVLHEFSTDLGPASMLQERMPCREPNPTPQVTARNSNLTQRGGVILLTICSWGAHLCTNTTNPSKRSVAPRLVWRTKNHRKPDALDFAQQHATSPNI